MDKILTDSFETFHIRTTSGSYSSDILLICGDCLEVIEAFAFPTPKVDMLFTDPPYGTTNCKWDCPVDLGVFWPAVNGILKKGACKALFSQTPFDKVLGCSNLRELRYEWIWEKNQATGHLNAKKMPMKAHENILILYDKLPTYNHQMTHGAPRKVSSAASKRNCKTGDVYGVYHATSYDSTDRYPRSVLKGPTDKQHCALHPTQKPVWLCEKIIRTYTNPGDVVLDCFMGSASIGVACQNTGRNYIGIEKHRQWFDISRERLLANAAICCP